MQSCPILGDPVDCSPTGPSVHGILQAGILECVATSSSWRIFSDKESNPCLLPLLCWQVDVLPLRNLGLLSRFSRVRLCATPETAAHQAPRPWDSPGKNTGVGCHFLLQCMKVKSEREVSQLCPTLSDPVDCSLPGSSSYRIFQARVLAWVAIAFCNYCV